MFQLGPKKQVPLSLIEEKWNDLALPKEQFDDMVRIGSFGGDVEWNKFFALCASTLGEVKYTTDYVDYIFSTCPYWQWMVENWKMFSISSMSIFLLNYVRLFIFS